MNLVVQRTSLRTVASPTMPPAQLASPSLRVIRFGVIAGWLLFTLMVIGISWGGSLVRGRPAEIGGLLLWNVGWLLWAGGTFAVAALARRFPVQRPRLAARLALHAAFGLLVAVATLALEFGLNLAVQSLWSAGPRATAFVGFLVYKLHVYFLIYWLVLGATRAWDYHTKYLQAEQHASELEARLVQAQLDALKGQLQPHFLFNTHHAIISLMLKQDNAAAVAMLTRLSDLLRVTLKNTRQVCSLQEEIETAELYLGIQRERYQDRLQVRVELDPAALGAEVPFLLLQPVLENAFKHGVDCLSSDAVVSLRARRQGDALEVCVTDNGPGFPPGFDRAATTGVGLRNTASRLQQLYGSAASIQGRNQGDGGGAEVRILIPYRTAPGVASTPAAVAHE